MMKTQQLRAAVRTILIHVWDPLAVRDTDHAHDAYDGYLSGIVRRLQSGADAYTLLCHLDQLERVSMGLSTPSGRQRAAASQLAALVPTAHRARGEQRRPAALLPDLKHDYYDARLRQVRPVAWDLHLDLELAWIYQGPASATRSARWPHPGGPLVTVSCLVMRDLDAVLAFFGDWTQHQSRWEGLHYLWVDPVRTTPHQVTLGLQWDRTGDEVRIMCHQVVVSDIYEPGAVLPAPEAAE